MARDGKLHKNNMTKVYCPKNGNIPTWANSMGSGGYRCTKCERDDHQQVKG